MRFIYWNLGLSAWLLISAFALSHTADSAALTGLMSVLIATFALAAPGLPGLRFVNAILALILAWAALLMPDLPGVARISNALVSAIVFALSLVPGRSTELPLETAAQPPAAQDPAHPKRSATGS